MISKHVLVIDDDSGTQTLLKDILEMEGYTVTPRDNGQEALKHLETDKPDIILLDIWMPKMDGYTFLKSFLHLHPLHQSTPILVLTADITAEKTLSQGNIEGYLTKPFRLKSLLALISQALAEREKKQHTLLCI